MIKIMGDENLLQGTSSPAILYETILVAKEFLDGELAKYGSWEECPPSLIKLLSLDSLKPKNLKISLFLQKGGM
jgi:hypothetical protein